jgi:hypothetical protein
MAKYIISFNDGAMVFPEEDLPAVDAAAHAVIREAKDASVFVFAGGLQAPEIYSLVDTDGTVTDGPFPEGKEYLGGLLVVEVPTREEALKWATKIAAACRCAQEVREFMFDPAV